MATTWGYVFKRGKLTGIEGIHSDTLGDIDKAIDTGIVRIRDHAYSVAFQGRSRSLILKAFAAFSDQIRLPKRVSLQWPGHYEEI